jgi:hypothetical protein
VAPCSSLWVPVGPCGSLWVPRYIFYVNTTLHYCYISLHTVTFRYIMLHFVTYCYTFVTCTCLLQNLYNTTINSSKNIHDTTLLRHSLLAARGLIFIRSETSELHIDIMPYVVSLHLGKKQGSGLVVGHPTPSP